jgi:glycosyltransferase involved in cell wall biosynthesis
MSVSIIIPVWNEASCLGRTLGSLQALNPPPHEVVVVDGGSTDRTVAIARAYGDRLAPYRAPVASCWASGADEPGGQRR